MGGTTATRHRAQELRTVLHNVTTLQPLVRAYALGYATAIGPRLIGFLRVARKREISLDDKINLLFTILKTSTHLNRLPTTCAIIVGGATALPRLTQSILAWLVGTLKKDRTFVANPRFAHRLRFVCTFFSAWVAFGMLNKDEEWKRKRAQSRSAAKVDLANIKSSPNQHHIPSPPDRMQYAGKTIDFTITALLRALDILAIIAWTRTRTNPYHPEQRIPRVAKVAKSLADPAIFSFSAAIIMWSWFYSPHRLPKAYNHWISQAAEIDTRLITALRLCRQGDLIYGQETGQAHLLEGLCKDLNLPTTYADPTKTIPIPCELYHCGMGKECETHALKRFVKAWKFAMKIYLPLQLLTRFRSPVSIKSCIAAFVAASRSSSFLAAFVSLFYYSVCLARTRLGPRLLSKRTITPQMWDSGLCVLAGCLTCGWSIFLEKPNRRQEIAFFVAPRALATLLPRVYDAKNRKREQLVFASSVAVVLGAAQDPRLSGMVRGVFGRVLNGVLRE